MGLNQQEGETAMKREYQKKLAESSSSTAVDEDRIYVPLDRIEVQQLLS